MYWHNTIALTSFLTVEKLSRVVQGVPNAASNFPLHLAFARGVVLYLFTLDMDKLIEKSIVKSIYN